MRAPEYERRKAEGCPWPGFVENYRELLPPGTDRERHPEFINPLDPDILARVVRAAKLEVIEAAFLPGAMAKSGPKTHAGVIASRPA
jgi:hypothetical protein